MKATVPDFNDPDLDDLAAEPEQPAEGIDQLLQSCGASALVEGCSIDVIVIVLRALHERL